jgi:hypothetical protein
VVARAAQVRQQGEIVTTRIFQGVGQNGEPVKGLLEVDRLGQGWHETSVPGQPGRLDVRWTERVADDLAQQARLSDGLDRGARRRSAKQAREEA